MAIERKQIVINGAVQGVGFRPFVYRIATDLNLTGGVKNTSQGVVVEVEGQPLLLEKFLQRLSSDRPSHAHIQAIEQKNQTPLNSSQLQILPSKLLPSDSAARTATRIQPDLAICADCLQELTSQSSRYYQYPFISCTQCGPRFSIISALPYDRCNTSMAAFLMCPHCQAEYKNPVKRRFHSQADACSQCGPSLSFLSTNAQDFREKDKPSSESSPLQKAVALIQQGGILAAKGIGGFQLIADACNERTIEKLRARKHRPDKPFALMYPSLEAIRQHCEVSEAAERLLRSPQAPIVLLPKRTTTSTLAKTIAPNSPYLGVMLPTTPMHHLLFHQRNQIDSLHKEMPLIATSGNVSGEPICIDNQLAQQQLANIADGFLLHNRPIQRPIDDSVVQFANGQPQILRHARGYAPQHIQIQPLEATRNLPEGLCILALGAHLKNAIALSIGEEIVLSQHIGDLDTARAREQLQKTVADLLSLYQVQPDAIAHDLHPDYASTQLAITLAKQWHIPHIPVQHHYAHILSGMAEHKLSAPVLGVAWDGTGYGLDRTSWGGEFLLIKEQPVLQGEETRPSKMQRDFERIAHLLPFPLPGGDICSRQPRRSALALLYSCYGEAAFKMTDLAPIRSFSKTELTVLQNMLSQQINTPMTSSAGRLFDGVAALLNLHQRISYESQAALTIEFAATQSSTNLSYPFAILETNPTLIDWRPAVRAIVEDYQQAVMTPIIAAKFHNTLVEIITTIAQRAGVKQIVLSGGCFQNKLLSEKSSSQLVAEGFTPYDHRTIPANDGGIAVGQILDAIRQLPSCTTFPKA